MQEDTPIEAESNDEEREFVAQSSKRTAVLERLAEGPAEPSKIATDQPVSTASAQSASEELLERGLLELLVTDETRAYGLTVKGEQVLFTLKETEEA